MYICTNCNVENATGMPPCTTCKGLVFFPKISVSLAQPRAPSPITYQSFGLLPTYAQSQASRIFSMELPCPAYTPSSLPSSPLTLENPHGNNFVDRILCHTDGSFIIQGRNVRGEFRSIIIRCGYPTIDGFNRSQDLGIVAKQMYKSRHRIFDDFRIPKPPWL